MLNLKISKSIILILTFNFLNLYSTVNLLDTTFGINSTGIVTQAFNSGSVVNGMAVDSNGNIVTVGNTNLNLTYNILVARYTQAGLLDTTFNTTGYNTYISGSQSTANCVAINSSNIIVAGNDGSSNILLLRYTNAGILDNSFGTGGSSVFTIGNGCTVNAMVIDNNSKIVVTGNALSNGQSYLFIARFNSSGSIDTTFGTNSSGYNLINSSGSTCSANSLAIDLNSKLVVSGSVSTSNGSNFLVVRFTTAGILDTTFNNTGIVSTNISGSYNNFSQAVTVDSSNRIIAAGYYINNTTGNSSCAIIRYLSTGTVDTTFGTNSNGIVINSIGIVSLITSCLIDLTGNIVISGSSDNNFFTARYTSNGSLDSTFGNSGILLTSINSSSQINAMALQSDGRVVAGGYDIQNSFQQSALVRYNKNNTDFVNITSITSGSTINTKIPSISGTSSVANAQVQILINGVLYTTVSTNSSGNWTAGISSVLPIGSNSIQANLIVNASYVVGQEINFSVIANFSEDTFFAYNSTNQTKLTSTFSTLPFNNIPLLGTWSYSNSVFTCNATGKYCVHYMGYAGATSLGLGVTGVNVAMMISVNGTEYVGSESNTNTDLATNSVKNIAKVLILNLTAGQTVSLNYAVNVAGTIGTSAPGLISNTAASGTQHAYSLAINRIG